MAKKKNNDDDLNLDFDFEEDDLFGGGDFDFEPKPIKDDRHPVVKAADSFQSKFKDKILSEEAIRGSLRKVLPDEVNETIGHVDNTLTVFSDAYNNTVKQLKPALRDVKRSGRALKQTFGNAIPENVSKWLDNILQDEDDGRRSERSETELRENEITSTLAGIFEKQTQQHGEERQVDQAMEITQIKQSGEQINLSAQVLKGVLRLADYQDQVGTKWQQKMLEISMRQYHMQASILKAFTEHAALLKENIPILVKNSALPDLVKQKNSEVLKDVGLRKLLANVQEGVFEKIGITKQIKNLGIHLNNLAQEKVVNPLLEIMAAASQGMDALGDMRQMQAEMGFGEQTYIESDQDRELKKGAGFLGDIAAGQVHGIGANWARNKLLQKEWVKNIASLFGRWNRKSSITLNDYYRNGVYFTNENGEETLTSKALNKIREMFELDTQARGTESGSISNVQMNLTNLHDPAQYTNYTQKSITEIIPGYLARILQSTEGIRTGSQADLLVFDHARNTFIDRSILKKDIQSKYDSMAKDVDYNTGRMKDLLFGRDYELNEEDKLAFKKYLIRTNRAGRLLDYENMIKEENNDTGLSGAALEALRQRYHLTMTKDKDGKEFQESDRNKRRDEIEDASESFGRRLPKELDLTRQISAAGINNMDILRELGFIEKDGKESHRIDSKTIFDYFVRFSEEAQKKEEENTRTNKATSQSISTTKGKNEQSPHTGAFPWMGVNPVFGAGAPPGIYPPLSGGSDIGNVLGQISTNISSLHHLLEDRLYEITSVLTAQTSPTQDHIQVDNQGIIGSINDQTIALLEALNRVNQNIISIGTISDGGRGQFIPTDVRPDEITSNLINWNKLARYGREGLVKGKDAIARGYGAVKKLAATAGSGMNRLVLQPIKNLMEKGAQKILTTDLYFPENLEVPVIKARDFALGLYCDAEGNIVRSLADVKGNLYKVVNGAKGSLLVTAEELRDGLVDQLGRKFDITKYTSASKRIFTSTMSFVKDKLNFLNPMKMVQTAKDMMTKAYMRTKELVMKDIYVGDEQNPRITGVQLMTGAFYCNGKQLFRAKDIVADVFDINGKLVLGIDELRNKGIFDREGKPYKDVLDNFLGHGANLLGGVMNLGRNAWEKIKKVGKGIKDIGFGALKGLFGKFDLSMEVNSKWTKRIYELLVWKFKGQPDHHRSDIQKDDATESKDVTKNLKDTGKKFKETWDNREEFVQKTKDGLNRVIDTVDKFKIGDETLREKAQRLSETKLGGKIVGGAQKLTEGAIDFNQQLRDEEGNIKLANAKRMMASKYELMAEKAGKIRDDMSEWQPEFIKKLKDKGDNRYIEYLLQFKKGWVQWNDLPKELEKNLRMFILIKHGLVKPDKDGKLMVNLAQLLREEAKRLGKEAKDIKDRHQKSLKDQIRDFRNRFKKEEKDPSQMNKRELKAWRKKKAEEERKKREKESLAKKESTFGGIINRFTGKLRSGSWRSRGSNTNKGKPQVGKDGKPVEKKGGFLNLLKNTIVMAGLAFKNAIMGGAKFLWKIVGSLGSIVKWAGKAIGGAGRFIGGLVSGKGTSGAARAGVAIRQGAMWVARHGATKLIPMAATLAGWAVIAGAVAGAGWLAYKAWKFFRDEFKELDEYRLACYGVHANNDANKSNKILAFEKAVDEVCSIDQKSGQLTFGKIDEKKWAAAFWETSVDGDLMEDKLRSEQLPRFKDWYLYRFLPIYKKFREALAAMEHGDVANLWTTIDGLYDMDDDMTNGYKPAFARMTFPKDKDVKPDGSPLTYFEYEGLPFSDHDMGALTYGQIEHYKNKVLEKFANDEARMKRQLGSQAAEKMKDGKFAFESNFELGIIGDRALGKEVKDWTVDEETKKQLEKGGAIVGSGKVKIKNQVTGEEREITAEQAATMVGYKGGVVSDFQLIRVSAYGLLPVNPEPFTVENVRTVLALENYLIKSNLFRMTDDVHGLLNEGPYKVEDAYDDESLTKLIDQFALKFGYDLGSIPDKEDFRRVLLERVFPIAKRIMGWMKKTDKTLWTSAQRTAVGSMDNMDNDKQIEMALEVADDSDLKAIVKKLERPGLFKAYPNMTDPDSAWSNSIKNLKENKKQTPAGLPEDESKRKEMVAKLKEKIMKDIQKRRAAKYGDEGVDLKFGEGYTNGTTNNITGVADGMMGTVFTPKSLPNQGGNISSEPLDLSGTATSLGEMNFKGLEQIKSFKGMSLAEIEALFAKTKGTDAKAKLVLPLLKEIADMTGVPYDLLAKVAYVESSFNPFAGASTSSAKGLYQFTSGTWKEMLEKHGGKIGLNANTGKGLINHPVINAFMGAMFIRDNFKRLKDIGIKDVGAPDMYGMHFMGPGYRIIRKFIQDNPGMTMSQIMQTGKTKTKSGDWLASSIRANGPIFYKGANTTAKEFYDVLFNKMEGAKNIAYLKSLGVPINGGKTELGAEKKPQLEAVDPDKDVHALTSQPAKKVDVNESVTDLADVENGRTGVANTVSQTSDSTSPIIGQETAKMDTYGSIESSAPTSGSNNAAAGQDTPTQQDSEQVKISAPVQASGNTSPSEMSKTNVSYPKGKDLLRGRPSIPHELRGPMKSGQLKVKNGIKPQALSGYDPSQRYYDAPPGKISKNRVDLLDPNTKEALNMLAYDYSVNLSEYQKHSKEKLPSRLYVTNSFRTEAEQLALKRAGYKANAPGGSAHEYGLAVDLSIPQAEALDKAGILEKYGLYRPVPKDPKEKQHVQAKMVVEASQSEQQLTKPAGMPGENKDDVESIPNDHLQMGNGEAFRGGEPVGGNTGTSMRPYAKPNDAIGLPDNDPAASGITGGFAQPEFPVSPTQQMQTVQDQQIAKQDAISLAKTEELLDKQVKLQEENNNIVREIVTLIKQKNEEKPQGLRNTNAQAAEMKSEEERMKEEAQRRVADGNMRVGPIMTSV